MEKYTNKIGKECYKGVTLDTLMKDLEFHLVEPSKYSGGDIQFALHTNLGSLTVLDRMTGFGFRDVETGYRNLKGDLIIASGNCDVRCVDVKTVGEAINWIKQNAGTLVDDFLNTLNK